MTKTQVIEVDYGLSSAYSDGTIEINRKIVGPLREKILKHELSHTSGAYNLKDFKTDFQSKAPYFFESLKFCWLNPEGFINFMPFLYSYYLNAWTFNWTSLYPFLIWGIFFSLVCKLLFHVSFFYALIGWINFLVVINVALLIYTHRYVTQMQKVSEVVKF